jgi:hypothetical protein
MSHRRAASRLQGVTHATWLRAGLIALIVVDGTVGAWQYLFPRSFYAGFPTVSLDPPFNEHLVSDVGGLNLALVTVLALAAVTLEYHLVMAALTGFAVYAVTHLLFHLLHLEHFSLAGAAGVGTGLGLEAALPFALMALARASRPPARPAAPPG